MTTTTVTGWMQRLEGNRAHIIWRPDAEPPPVGSLLILQGRDKARFVAQVREHRLTWDGDNPDVWDESRGDTQAWLPNAQHTVVVSIMARVHENGQALDPSVPPRPPVLARPATGEERVRILQALGRARLPHGELVPALIGHNPWSREPEYADALSLVQFPTFILGTTGAGKSMVTRSLVAQVTTALGDSPMAPVFFVYDPHNEHGPGAWDPHKRTRIPGLCETLPSFHLAVLGRPPRQHERLQHAEVHLRIPIYLYTADLMQRLGVLEHLSEAAWSALEALDALAQEPQQAYAYFQKFRALKAEEGEDVVWDFDDLWPEGVRVGVELIYHATLSPQTFPGAGGLRSFLTWYLHRGGPLRFHLGTVRSLLRSVGGLLRRRVYARHNPDGYIALSPLAREVNTLKALVNWLLAGESVVLSFGQFDGEDDQGFVLNTITAYLSEMYRQHLDPKNKKPLVFIIEEAHRYLASGQPTQLRQVAREMRKYGVTLWLVDQRIAGIDPDVLAMVNTYFVMMLNDAASIRTLEQFMPPALDRTHIPNQPRTVLAFGRALPVPTTAITLTWPDQAVPDTLRQRARPLRQRTQPGQKTAPMEASSEDAPPTLTDLKDFLG